MASTMPKPDFDSGTKLRLGRLLAKTVSKFFEDEANRAEFEKWYLETHGTNYVWKKGVAKMSDVKCLCWNCGREILTSEATTFVNEEIWCSDCASPINGESEDPNND